MDEIVNSRLADAVESYAVDGGNAYVAQMWRYALASEEGRGTSPSSRCDAIPYLPFKPDDYGVRLSEDSRILDVGCLGGYGLFDVARRLSNAGQPVPKLVGVDVDPETVLLARKLGEIWSPHDDVSFSVSSAEALHPGQIGHFDLVIARLVLPYTDVRSALAAMRSVLSEKGLLFLQVHAPRYYCQQSLNAWPAFKKAFYYLMPIVVYGLFCLFRHQLYLRGYRESALNGKLLSGLAAPHGLRLRETGGFATKPWFVYGVQHE